MIRIGKQYAILLLLGFFSAGVTSGTLIGLMSTTARLKEQEEIVEAKLVQVRQEMILVLASIKAELGKETGVNKERLEKFDQQLTELRGLVASLEKWRTGPRDNVNDGGK